MSLETNGSELWLKADLFENILHEIIPNYKRINSFKFGRALKPGENYATIMLRIEIEAEVHDGKNESVSFMIKTPFPNEEFMEKFSIMFDIEAEMYLNIVPDFEEMFKKVGRDVKFCARCFKLKTDNPNILLEDLRCWGFRMPNRHNGLDLEHTEWVLKKIAQWHAASAVRFQTKGSYGKVGKGYFTPENREFMSTNFAVTSDVALQCLEKIPEIQAYMGQVRDFQSESISKIFDILNNYDENEFLVLNHGDLWANNVMFQYTEGGDIKDVFLVDYQVPNYGSPVFDLFYFLLTSTEPKVKLEKLDYFFSFYHKHLVENLSVLGYTKKIPTLKDLHTTCIRHGALAYNCVINIAPIVLGDSTDNANLDNFMDNGDDGVAFKMGLYSTERYQKHVQILLPWLINRGSLEL